MDGRFGPSHDRVALSAREQQAIERLELDLATRARRPDPLPLGLRARLLALFLVLRRPAIGLLPIGAAGMVLTVAASLPTAVAFALAWLLGFSALVVEIRSWGRRVGHRLAS